MKAVYKNTLTTIRLLNSRVYLYGKIGYLSGKSLNILVVFNGSNTLMTHITKEYDKKKRKIFDVTQQSCRKSCQGLVKKVCVCLFRKKKNSWIFDLNNSNNFK